MARAFAARRAPLVPLDLRCGECRVDSGSLDQASESEQQRPRAPDLPRFRRHSNGASPQRSRCLPQRSNSRRRPQADRPPHALDVRSGPPAPAPAASQIPNLICNGSRPAPAATDRPGRSRSRRSSRARAASVAFAAASPPTGCHPPRALGTAPHRAINHSAERGSNGKLRADAHTPTRRTDAAQR